MIAVAQPGASYASVKAFAKRYGNAPVTVYYDPSGNAFRNYSDGTVPSAAFWNAKGKRRGAFRGWPGG